MTRQSTAHELIFLCRISGGQQCKLSCIAQVGIRQFAKYVFGFVDDGTRCDDYDENSGICITGKCQVRPCENTLRVTDPQLFAHLFTNFDKSKTRISKFSQCIIEKWSAVEKEKSKNREKIP